MSVTISAACLAVRQEIRKSNSLLILEVCFELDLLRGGTENCEDCHCHRSFINSSPALTDLTELETRKGRKDAFVSSFVTTLCVYSRL